MKRMKLDLVRVAVVRDGSIKWEHEDRYTAPKQVADAARGNVHAKLSIENSDKARKYDLIRAALTD